MRGSAPQLNTAIQAVDVFLEIDGKPVKGLIPREVFEHRLGSGSGPKAWLRSYEKHADVLNRAIKRRFAAKPQDLVVVRSSDFGSTSEDMPE